MFLKKNLIVTKQLGNFCQKSCHQELSKNVQSGHTDRELLSFEIHRSHVQRNIPSGKITVTEFPPYDLSLSPSLSLCMFDSIRLPVFSLYSYDYLVLMCDTCWQCICVDFDNVWFLRRNFGYLRLRTTQVPTYTYHKTSHNVS